MRHCKLMIVIMTVCTGITGVLAAELDVPPPGKPKELSVFVNQPNCSRWTDECVTCTRETDTATAPVCSNIGIACQPKAIRCLSPDTPKSEPKSEPQKSDPPK
ncbi:hypothetical protein [Bradyrhizobium sp. SYSU BS000235]|uniref:hypothetical protein n=1 Tax=Bradyrhizobium sp. SYSU BS000235 TaxID=3411332 RepID=UPI003C77348B